jgi:ABC-2 type transport system permease protein
MGLFANEKTNGTQELLMTSPLTMWELVLGKFLAAAAFVTILIAMMALFPALLFLDAGTPVLGLIFSGFDLADPNPEGLQMWAGLLGLWLLGLTYAAVGTFSSSLTRNQLVAFFLALALLLILWLLSVVADLGVAEGAAGTASRLSGVLTWLSTSDHFDKLARGLVDTRDLAYFVFMIGTFLVLTKTSVESVRWR